MKAPGLDDRIVDVTAYLTDETFGADHWRATQFSSPVADHKRPALLLITSSEGDRDVLRAVVEQALAQRDGAAVRSVGSLAKLVDAAERMQAAAYDLPDGALRTRLISDSVVVLQELARLAAPEAKQ